MCVRVYTRAHSTVSKIHEYFKILSYYANTHTQNAPSFLNHLREVLVGFPFHSNFLNSTTMNQQLTLGLLGLWVLVSTKLPNLLFTIHSIVPYASKDELILTSGHSQLRQ